jgi:hypothetical protein
VRVPPAVEVTGGSAYRFYAQMRAERLTDLEAPIGDLVASPSGYSAACLLWLLAVRSTSVDGGES